MCKDPQFLGIIGRAYVGTLCRASSVPGANAGVNEKRQNVLATSEVHKNNKFLINYMELAEFYKICHIPRSSHMK